MSELQTYGRFERRVRLTREYPVTTLAFGSQLKNTLCLIHSREAFISPVVQDLEEADSFDQYSNRVRGILERFPDEPVLLAHDLHPDYLSSKLAREIAQEDSRFALLAVQHHHAHVASVLAEYGIDKPVIGVALDGTGYGTDETLWGGEVLVATASSFRRAAWLKPIRLPGGARAIREPWLVGISYLYEVFGDKYRDLSMNLVEQHDDKELAVIETMLDRRLNSPLSSGCGRLFDGVAAVLGARDRVAVEGEAAMELEKLMGDRKYSENDAAYILGVLQSPMGLVLDPGPMFTELVQDVASGVDGPTCSTKFHNGLVNGFGGVVSAIALRERVCTVVLSGGCFLNRYLREGLSRKLSHSGLTVLIPQALPVGDAGLSLGQAIVAANAQMSVETGPVFSKEDHAQVH
jgi:hydrogenase maturation protein HypF